MGGGGGTVMPLMFTALGAAAGGAATGGSPMGMMVGAQAGGALGGGLAQQQAGEQGAQSAEAAAEAEKAAGEQRGAAIRQQLIDTLSTQTAALSARGIGQAGGTSDDLASAARRAGTLDLASNRFNTLQKLGGYAGQAQQSRLSGIAGLIGGFGQAASVGTSYLAYRQGLGTTPNPTTTPAGPRPLFSRLGY
jgi:hypothetical protein